MSNPKQNSYSNAIDVVCLTFVALLLILTVAFPGKVLNASVLAKELFIAGSLYFIGTLIVRQLSNGFLNTVLQTLLVLALFSFLFKAVDGFQHLLINGWMDDTLLSMEYWLTGTESTLILQKLTNPILTEWMMFAYVLYIPLLPAIALICYSSAGVEGTRDYLFNLSLANVVCYVGFILFPVASPLYHWPELYTVSLDGGFFAWCGEWIRHTQHYAGGSLPSPHCAAGTIMFAMAYRYNRKIFYISLPTFLTLYVSTVYGRYHYVWDGIAGILAAVLVLKYSPKLVTVIESLRNRLSSLHPVSPMPESISEYE